MKNCNSSDGYTDFILEAPKKHKKGYRTLPVWAGAKAAAEPARAAMVAIFIMVGRRERTAVGVEDKGRRVRGPENK